MSKYKGIDSREIKCCDPSKKTIEAGISFDNDEGQNILRFHFLDYITTSKLVPSNNGGVAMEQNSILTQETKSMWLNKENTEQLIKALKGLKFKK